MKKIIYGALFGILFAVVILSVGANTNGAPVLTYVYSNSMEPLIKVNDAFLVWPTSNPKVGDIIMYRPVILNAPYITHRIIEIGEEGYITKGDNSPYKDQESGEPEVLPERIIGKVVTLNGKPLIISGMGRLAANMKSLAGNYSRFFSVIFLLSGILLLLTGNRHSAHKRKPRYRLRLRHLYKSIVIIAALFIMISIYFGSRVTQIKYLVSEYPGNMGDQVEVNQTGRLVMKVKNNGFIPAWTILNGVKPLRVQAAPGFLWPRSSETAILEVMPEYRTGMYQGYVQVYNYPVLLPRTWIVLLHQLNPFFAIIAAGLAYGIMFQLFFAMISRIHGLEGWIPLRSIKDKFLERRTRRATAKVLGKRRYR